MMLVLQFLDKNLTPVVHLYNDNTIVVADFVKFYFHLFCGNGLFQFSKIKTKK